MVYKQEYNHLLEGALSNKSNIVTQSIRDYISPCSTRAATQDVLPACSNSRCTILESQPQPVGQTKMDKTGYTHVLWGPIDQSDVESSDAGCSDSDTREDDTWKVSRRYGNLDNILFLDESSEEEPEPEAMLAHTPMPAWPVRQPRSVGPIPLTSQSLANNRAPMPAWPVRGRIPLTSQSLANNHARQLAGSVACKAPAAPSVPAEDLSVSEFDSEEGSRAAEGQKSTKESREQMKVMQDQIKEWLDSRYGFNSVSVGQQEPLHANGQPAPLAGQSFLCNGCTNGGFCSVSTCPQGRERPNLPAAKNNKLRPCKGKRERYKKLVARLHELIEKDPEHFDLQSVELPQFVASNESMKARITNNVKRSSRRIKAEKATSGVVL